VNVNKSDNPFYHNYVFSKFDLNRHRIKWWEYPFLLFCKTYVQFSDGYAFFFKYGLGGRYFLMKVERLPDS